MTLSAWDLSIVQALYAMRTPFGVDFFSVITNLGGAVVVILVLIAAFLILRRGRRWPYAVGMMVSLAGSMGFAETIKLLVARPRPPLYLHAIFETGYSFPSNHSTAAMALYGFLVYAIWKREPARWRSVLVFVCAVIILLVGFSRVYLGVHYPSDVLGGYAMGLLFVWIGARVAHALSRFAE